MRCPATLAVLASQFLDTVPPDVANGEPLHYRRTKDGLFVLYSVGWNGKDDGGMIGRTGTGRHNPKLGHWVWQYPTN